MKIISRYIAFVSLCFFSVCVLSGCSDNAPAKVTGTITLDGKPVADAIVTFTPEDGSRISQAQTHDNGWYELRFSAQLKGAAVGKHRVRIQTGDMEVGVGTDAPVSQERIPTRYNVETELTATLKSGKNTVNFELTSE
jgi:hypothetical protein